MEAARDQNHVASALGVSSADANLTLPFKVDSVTGRLLVDSASGTGTVTSFSFTDANGFDGTVTNSTTTPNLTLAITVAGVLKGAAGALVAADASTDFAAVAFKTIAVSGQSDVVADTPIDTLTLVAGTNITITTNAATDAITINASGSTGVNSVSGTANRISVGGTAADPVIDISSSYVGQASITTLGTIGTGTWQGTVIAGQYGGTGVANTSKTITIGGNFTMSGAFTFTGTVSGNTSVTFPTSGTLITTTDIANMVTAASTFGTDESILRADGTSRGSQGTTNNAVLTDAGAMTLASTITATGLIPTSSTATGNRVYLPASNTLGFAVNGTGEVQIDASATSPITNAGNALGTTSLGWNGLNLATTTTINWANSNVVLTHSSGILTVSTGELRITTVGTNTASVPTLGSTSTLTNKRIQPRTASSTTASNLSPDLSTANVYFRTTQTATLTIDAPTGTPVIGEVITIYVDSAGAQTLTINATYVVFGSAFPATTTAGKTFMMTAQYNGTNWKTTWANAV